MCFNLEQREIKNVASRTLYKYFVVAFRFLHTGFVIEKLIHTNLTVDLDRDLRTVSRSQNGKSAE